MGYPIQVAVGTSDAPGWAVSYEVLTGPLGIAVAPNGPQPRVLWTPQAAEVGPQFVRIRAAERCPPFRSVLTNLVFTVREATSCELVRCEPLVGCSAALKELGTPCCEGSVEPVRVPLARLPCPQGLGIWVGRNLNEGFGRVQNCDQFRVINFGQIGATVRLNLAVRCLDVSEPLSLSVSMRTAERQLFHAPRVIVRLQPNDDGVAVRHALGFPVQGPGPFFEFEGAEADLFVRAEDAQGQAVETRLRLRLTFEDIPDIADLVPVDPPWRLSGGGAENASQK
ncbi:MAG: hypothetical protein N3C12_09475 [Candidatus Binatia bacterium]|nr:hypothetical protein [Candidatus Binatia bacterium]